MTVIKKRIKNPSPKPGLQKCSCGYVVFYTRNVDDIIKKNIHSAKCGNCHKKLIISEWKDIIRKNKINNILNR